MKDLLLSIQKNAFGLALFAVVTAGAIAVTQYTTKERIELNIERAAARALNEIVAPSEYDNDMITDTIAIDQSFDSTLLGNIQEDDHIYVARRNGEIHTLIFPVVNPDGYTTDIKMIVGVKANGTVAGVRVIEHRETPGLGDKIDIKKSDWILSFNDKSLTNPSEDAWAVQKDGGEFDQFTGATITPRAIVSSVKNVLTFFEQHKDQLIGQRLVEPMAQVK